MIEQRGPESPASSVFVGRSHALAELDAALDAAEGGRGSLVLVTGDPGIGKTRLVGELAVRARARDTLVLWGTCWEGGGAPAYWPWAQVLRAWMHETGVTSLDLVGPRTLDLAPLLPEHASDASGAAKAEDAERVRFRLFDALADALLHGAEHQPMLVVLDDLHWADTSSLLALRFVAGELHRGGLLVVGMFRDLEVDRGHPLASALADLDRMALRLPLSGLVRAEVARVIAITTGAEPEPDVVDAVLRRTGGNPLFVRELVRLAWVDGSIETLADDPSATGAMPASVREVIGRRLVRLPSEARAILEVGAVEGEEFMIGSVARVAGIERHVALDALEHAIGARLAAGIPDAPARYGFAHPLIREVLYQGMSAERRASLHGRTGEVLEELHGDAPEHLAAIALHYVRAAPLGEARRALRYAQLAGEQAMVTLAWEEAARHYERALGMLDLEPGADGENLRCDLHLALGRARVRAGETEAARDAFRAAAALARDVGDSQRLAAAALGLGSASPVWGVDPELVELLDEARDGLGEAEDASLRARVLARLAQAQYYTVSDADRDALSREGVEVARAARDDRALADALTAQRVLWGPDDLAGRMAIADELAAVARRLDDLDLEVRARSWRVVDLVEGGDLSKARGEIHRHAVLADRLRQPIHLRDGVVWRAMEALIDGRFDQAEVLADEALVIGERIQDPGASSIHGVQKVMILAEQADPARLDETVALAREGSEAHPDIPAWRALLAFSEARAGRLDDARADLERAGGDGFAGVPRDAVFLVTLTHAADAAAMTGHRQIAGHLRGLLEAYADRWVVIDRGLACKGSTERLIGLLDGVLGDTGSSVERLDRALAQHVHLGARAFAARNRRELASALLARGGSGDAGRAASLLDDAETEASRLGMPGLLSEIAAARSGGRGAVAARAVSDEEGVFRQEGEFWTLSFVGRSVRLRDVKGLHDIASLLAQPGRETHVLDLMGAADTQGGGDAVDPHARRAYRARLEDLQQEIDDAEGDNDLERAARARAEAEFLTAELSAAIGLGGRPRQVSSAPERARKAVTWRIRAAIDRVEREHSELGRHLRVSIRTGTFCSYMPEHPVAWRVEGIT